MWLATVKKYGTIVHLIGETGRWQIETFDPRAVVFDRDNNEVAAASLNQDEIEFELADGGWTKRVRLSYYVTENDRGQTLRKLGVDAPPSIGIKV